MTLIMPRAWSCPGPVMIIHWQIQVMMPVQVPVVSLVCVPVRVIPRKNLHSRRVFVFGAS